MTCVRTTSEGAGFPRPHRYRSTLPSRHLVQKFIEFCNATQGEWAVKNLSTGETALRTAGSRWRSPPKGIKVNITNTGNVPAVQFVYRLVEKGM